MHFEDETNKEAGNQIDSSKSTTRGARVYIKEVLLDHDMWKDGRFWEQSLWQCVMEQVIYLNICILNSSVKQLQTFRFGGAWYDLTLEERTEAVKRVHEVAFSQV